MSAVHTTDPATVQPVRRVTALARIDDVIRLGRNGYSPSAIASQLGVSRSSVIRAIRIHDAARQRHR